MSPDGDANNRQRPGSSTSEGLPTSEQERAAPDHAEGSDASSLHALLVARRPSLADAISAARLAAVVDAAERAWPSIRIDRARFVAHLVERLPTRTGVADVLESVHTDDLYLACACAHRDHKAIAAFDRLHLSRLGGAIAQVNPSADFIEEARQQLRERLFVGDRPRIGEYTGVGPLSGWVRVAALRLALNSVRGAKRNAAIRPPERSARDPDLELIYRQYGHEVEKAFRYAFRRLDGEARDLLRLHYLDKLTFEDLGRRLGVDRSTMSRRLAAVRTRLLDDARAELRRLLPAVAGPSLDSLLRALRSRIDVGLESALHG